MYLGLSLLLHSDEPSLAFLSSKAWGPASGYYVAC